MKAIHELKTILERELEQIVMKGDVTPAELENSKHIVEIFAMVKALDGEDDMDEGHSGRGVYEYKYPSQRYVDWGYGRSYMAPDRNHYGETYDSDYGRSYGSRRMGGGYSGHEPMEYIISELRRLHAKTSDDRDRGIIADCIEQLEH